MSVKVEVKERIMTGTASEMSDEGNSLSGPQRARCSRMRPIWDIFHFDGIFYPFTSAKRYCVMFKYLVYFLQIIIAKTANIWKFEAILYIQICKMSKAEIEPRFLMGQLKKTF